MTIPSKRRRTTVVLATLLLLFLGVTAAGWSETVQVVSKPQYNGEPCVVGIAQGQDYEATTREAIQAAGGLSEIVTPGCTVLIKPNIVGASPSGAGRITDYRVVQAVADVCLELGAGEVIVAESPVEVPDSVGFRVAGYYNLENVTLTGLDASPNDCYLLQAENSLTGRALYLPKLYMDADVIIDVPILKTHYTAGVTLGLKNLGIGVPPKKVYGPGLGWKKTLHDFGVHRVIVDVNAIRPPDFVVIDGMVGGEGHGPTQPTPVRSGLVIAGDNVVAVDTVGTLVMGFEPWRITHLVWAASQGLGPIDLDHIRVRGKQISEVQQDYKPAPPQPQPYQATTVIRRAASTVSIDGDLGEWDDAWTNELRYPLQVEAGSNWGGEDDISATFMLLHDLESIYFAFQVRDDELVTAPESSRRLPDGDALIILLSTNHGVENGPKRQRYNLVRNDARLLVQQTSTGARLLTFPGFEAVSTATVARKKTAEGYILEGQIPLKEAVDRVLDPHESFYLDFILQDVDNDGHALSMFWNLPGDQLTNPRHCGRALID